MRYIFSGQDARTTRVSSFNFVPHKSRNRCIKKLRRFKFRSLCLYS
ncbi:MAG: hypothetical protein ACKPKW_27270 [Dolichospermum sp.]